jgi:Fe-S-cluster-containing dehydrogenase component
MTPAGDDGMEFLPETALPPDGRQRREFVKLLGASLALAGLGGCVRAPDEEIHALVAGAANSVPGVPQHYATAMSLDGFATGVVVESVDGRPTKIEGNPEHPASLGGAGIFEQASILELYDPRRVRAPYHGVRRTTAHDVATAFGPQALAAHVGPRGAALGLLLEPSASPLMRLMLDRVRTRFPEIHVHFHAPLENPAVASASRAAFGEVVVAQHDFRHANIVVALGGDPLASGPFHLRYARDFSHRRRSGTRPLLYVAESAPSPTSTLADSRIAVSPAALDRISTALLAEVIRGTPQLTAQFSQSPPSTHAMLTESEQRWVSGAAAQLLHERGRGLVIAGPLESERVHIVAHALNAALQNVGACVSYTPSPIIEAGAPSHDIALLDKNISALDTLVVLQGNICYSAPGDTHIARQYGAIPHTLYVGSFSNETARLSGWHLPATHYLEEWGVERAYDGTESIIQPLIAPLHGGRSVIETLAMIAGVPDSRGYSLAREYWAGLSGGAGWSDVLRQGVVPDTAFAPVRTSLDWPAIVERMRPIHNETDTSGTTVPGATAPGVHALQLVFSASRALHDGRYADNPWLQELPDPVTKLTWDNAALVSLATARALGVGTGDIIALESAGRRLDIPVLLVPGHANDTISLAMGYGRSGGERLAHGVGADINMLRTAASPYQAAFAHARAIGGHRELAITQSHFDIGSRSESVLGHARAPGKVDTVLVPANPGHSGRKPLTLYEPSPPAGRGRVDQWAMTIDLDQCTGCSACVVACQSENNIPVVGRDDVLKGREMHWMRIDRYVSDDEAATHIDVQPMLCQQCEKAPCEYVCPVEATVHSDDGLNEMVYNRCVGTRFCSNNCPYKVRRFNWFEYNAHVSAEERMQKNPEVTVRARGVMEKCTFCVQRIRRAQQDAELAGEQYVGPLKTACQQTCPTEAIVFGSLTSPGSAVAASGNDPRAFSALEELGTVPRVKYLARPTATS